MAVVPFSTKVLSYNPKIYLNLSEASGNFVNQGTLGTAGDADNANGNPQRQQTSLLKDGSDFSVRMNNGKIKSNGNPITTVTGFTLAFLIDIETEATATQEILRIGTVTSGSPHIQLQNKPTIGGFVIKTGITGGVHQKDVGGAAVGQRLFITITGDLTTELVEVRIDGRVRQSATATADILALTDADLEFNRGQSLVYFVDEFAFFDTVLTESQIVDLFRSTRAVDDNATTFYVTTAGSSYGKGTEADPLNLSTAANWSIIDDTDNADVIISGGTYTQGGRLKIEVSNTGSNRITFRNKPGELVRIRSTAADNIIEFESQSQNVDLKGYDYGSLSTLGGIIVENANASRTSWYNNYPDENPLQDGTITNDTFTTTNPDVLLASVHVGHAVRVTDNVGTLLFSSTILSIQSSKDCTFADSYGGTLPLSSTARMYVDDTLAFRRNQSFLDTGVNNRVIGVLIQDIGTAFTSFEPASQTGFYYNICRNSFWVAPDRQHGHGFYIANDGANGQKVFKGNIIYNETISQRAESVSGRVEKVLIEHGISWNENDPQNVYNHRFRPSRSTTGTGSAASDQLTVADATGLNAGDRLRIVGANHYDEDFYVSIEAVAGSVITLVEPLPQAVTDATVTKAVHDTNFSLLAGSDTSNASYDIEVKNNRLLGEKNDLNIGYTHNNNLNAVVTGNFAGYINSQKWETLTVTGNTFYHRPYRYTSIASIFLLKKRNGAADHEFSKKLIDNNTYYELPGRTEVGGKLTAFHLDGLINNRLGSPQLPFEEADPVTYPNNQWKDYEGELDSNSTFTPTAPTSNIVYVDAHDSAIVGFSGGANITVINVEDLASVSVNLSGIGLVNGQQFQIRDAENFTEDWGRVFVGTYSAASPTVNVPFRVTDTAANFASLPGTGTWGTNYQTTDNNNWYRWNGSGYTQINHPYHTRQPEGWEAEGYARVPGLKHRGRAVYVVQPFSGAPGYVKYDWLR